MNRQNLHLNERADETGLGKLRGLHPCFTQGQFSRIAEGLQHGSKAQQVSRQAKPCRPVYLQQSLSKVLGCDGSAVLLAPPVQAVCASSLGAPAEHAVVEELTDIAGRGASADTAPACDLYSLRDQGLLSVNRSMLMGSSLRSRLSSIRFAIDEKPYEAVAAGGVSS
ncbi:hypothetical protein [Streptomyces zaomyceticus]|uniref:hypothetical protein n=1 Tax=Streptomyces zaomyceticus TaxID=68286 RepID=UPI002F90EDE6